MNYASWTTKAYYNSDFRIVDLHINNAMQNKIKIEQKMINETIIKIFIANISKYLFQQSNLQYKELILENLRFIIKD